MKLFSKIASTTLLLASLTLTGCSKYRQQAPGNEHDKTMMTMTVKAANITKKQQEFAKPWSYTPQRKFQMLTLDWQNRALGSHIQIKNSQLPRVKRNSRLYVNPSGWHNYKFTTNKNGRPYVTWLFNRGHLVGYQFCGLNDEPRNLVTETAYLNQGSLTGMDDGNDQAMLFYENNLRRWLQTHPQDKLDYAVIPLYKGTELVPRQILLSFVGVRPSNTQVKIMWPNLKAKPKGKQKVTQVILNNDSPQAKINYQTGRAIVQNWH